MARQQQDLKFPPFNDEPGKAFRKFRRDLLSYAANKTDESGTSVGDHLLDVDMGGGAVGVLLPSPIIQLLTSPR